MTYLTEGRDKYRVPGKKIDVRAVSDLTWIWPFFHVSKSRMQLYH